MKVFVMTPWRLKAFSISQINEYIRKAAAIMKTIAGDKEELEFTNNFFIENDGDKETLRNEYDELAYMSEELALISEADVIVVPPEHFATSPIYALLMNDHSCLEIGARRIVVMPIDFEGDF